jgi:hypothetical protein
VTSFKNEGTLVSLQDMLRRLEDDILKLEDEISEDVGVGVQPVRYNY